MAIDLTAPGRTDTRPSGIESSESDYERTAVVGRANLDGKDGTFFLVVNVKVLD